MATTHKSRAAAPAPASASTPAPAPAANSRRAGGVPSIPPEGSDVAAIENLRRQVIALQRISSLGVLAGGVFHELNNALTPILNYAKLGLRNPDPAYRERALTQIVDASQRAATITRGMLGLTRPGGGIDHREPTDVVRLVKEVIVLVEKDMTRHRVKLDVKLTGQPSARVNPAQIQQVLLNLLINARQAMLGKGGSITIKAVRMESGEVRIQVIDTGPGIPEKLLPKIFQPFFTTKATARKGEQKGTGLGLAICKEIIEHHKGQIEVQSEVGKGTMFSIYLPPQ